MKIDINDTLAIETALRNINPRTGLYIFTAREIQRRHVEALQHFKRVNVYPGESEGVTALIYSSHPMPAAYKQARKGNSVKLEFGAKGHAFITEMDIVSLKSTQGGEIYFKYPADLEVSMKRRWIINTRSILPLGI